MSDRPRPRVGRPVRISVPCAGLEPGDSVTLKVFEVTGLGGDPLETFEATVAPEGGVAQATWTYDHSKHEGSVASATFVLVAEGAGRTSASLVVEFVDLFEATVKDAKGNPAAFSQVRLHADRGPAVDAATDQDGKVSALVPPGKYHLELLGPLPNARVLARDQATPSDQTTAVAAVATAPDTSETAADATPDGGAKDDAASFLSVQFLDQTGRVPAASLAFQVLGLAGTTDDEGLARLSGVPAGDIEVTFDGGSALVPSVSDSSLIYVVRLRFLAPPDDAPARSVPAASGDDAPPAGNGDGELTHDEDDDATPAGAPTLPHGRSADDGPDDSDDSANADDAAPADTAAPADDSTPADSSANADDGLQPEGDAS